MVRAPATPHTPGTGRAARADRAADARAGAAAAGADADPDARPGLSRRARIIVAVAASVALLLVVAGIAAAIAIPRAAQTPVQTAPPGESGLTVSSVPVPKLVSATTTDGGRVAHFVWRNPHPRQGDAYLWARSETPGKVTHVTKPEATLTGIAPGQKVCITVWTLRDGRTSAGTLSACAGK